jgi:AcrR family transcriptional regulator
VAIVVEHEKRRKEILEKALDLFIEEGYEDMTLQKIALRCGITRTTLYIYFRNKKDIFNYSIKQFMAGIESEIQKVRRDKHQDAVSKLITILSRIIDTIEANRRLLLVVLDYLNYLAKGGGDPDQRIRRRTIRLRHILATMMIDGIRAGEIAPVNVRDADDLLYGLIETALFRLVVLKRDTVSGLKRTVVMAIRQLAAKR